MHTVGPGSMFRKPKVELRFQTDDVAISMGHLFFKSHNPGLLPSFYGAEHRSVFCASSS